MIVFLLSFFAMAHDAAFELDDSVYMFHGGNHVRYQKGASKAFEGYPKPIDDEQWPGLAVFRTRIVAAMNQTPTEVLFFLSDGRFMRYDAAKKLVVEGPLSMDGTQWSSLSPFATSITAAYRWNEQHSFFFLTSGRVVRYDHTEKRIDAEGALPISDTILGSIQPGWGDVQQVFSWSDTSVFLFFSSGVYVKYDREQQQIAENYPKQIDDRRWPGMGEWLVKDSRLTLSPILADTIEKETQIAFSLPQHVHSTEHDRKKAQKNGRFLTVGTRLVASSEYPDVRSSFRLIPVGENVSHGYRPFLLQDSAGRFLTMKGARVITTEKKKNAEVFFLDTTWGEFVILSHHKSHPKWKENIKLPKPTSLRPISFVANGESVVAVSQDDISAGSLLQMWTVQ